MGCKRRDYYRLFNRIFEIMDVIIISSGEEDNNEMEIEIEIWVDELGYDADVQSVGGDGVERPNTLSLHMGNLPSEHPCPPIPSTSPPPITPKPEAKMCKMEYIVQTDKQLKC